VKQIKKSFPKQVPGKKSPCGTPYPKVLPETNGTESHHLSCQISILSVEHNALIESSGSDERILPHRDVPPCPQRASAQQFSQNQFPYDGHNNLKIDYFDDFVL
jgi:hypothetical protein